MVSCPPTQITSAKICANNYFHEKGKKNETSNYVTDEKRVGFFPFSFNFFLPVGFLLHPMNKNHVNAFTGV